MKRRICFYGIAVLTLAAALAPGQSSPPFTITTTSLPDGALLVLYGPQTLSTANGYEEVPVWSIIAGQLPPGVSLAPDTGTISGTPTSTGLFSFTVQAYEYDLYTPLTATQQLTIFVSGAPIAITNPSLPSGQVGVAYTQAFAMTGGGKGDTQVWSLYAGTPPPGIYLSQAGVLTGTPTASGTYSIGVEVDDTSPSGGVSTATRLYTLVIAPAGAPITITTNSSLPAGTVGVAYAQPIIATGGTPPYTWNVESGALPDGVSLNAATGVISGAPTKAGTFNFQLSATDQTQGKATASFSLVVSQALSITTDAALPGGVYGVLYSTTLAATGGTAPYTWSVLSQGGPLPPGLTLDPSTGRLTGTPTASGSYQFQAGVADANGRTGSKLLTLNIEVALAITTASPLPGGAIGTPYQLQLTSTGGTSPFTWSIAGGALPAGLTLDPSTGSISGTPTAGGNFSVTIGVKDTLQSATKAFQLSIPLPALPAVTITGLPDTSPPATQPAMGISLGAAYAQDLTGHAALTFAPIPASDDPAVQFTTGGRSADFQIPAGTTQAVFGGSSLGVQTGTVAGTITITLQFLANGADVTPTPAPTKVIQIAVAPPVITSAGLTSGAGGFTLTIIGYSTTREVTDATLHLTPTSGTMLATSDFTIPLTSPFTAWYQDPASTQYGSQFSLSIPFTVQNATTAIGSLTVRLANSQGSSSAATATF